MANAGVLFQAHYAEVASGYEGCKNQIFSHFERQSVANRRAALKLERPELALKAGQAERLRFAQLNMRLASPFPASLELLFEPMPGPVAQKDVEPVG